MSNPQLAVASRQAAEAFLATLEPSQRSRCTATFDDDATRRDWHYIPRSRPGLCLADMSAVQQKAAIDMLRAGLTEASFATACLVMALEDVLDDRERGSGPRRGKQRGWGRHRAEYHAIVFGSPDAAEWGWRFEGHHLSVTITVVADAVSCTPHFLGANPASVDGSYRLLAPEQDLAFALIAAMTAEERTTAVVSDTAPDDILTTNDARVVLPPEQGVVVGDLSVDARTVAHALAAQYASRLPATATVDVDRLRFVFAGSPRPGAGHYYRFQGERYLVEYDNTQDGANHIHTVVRDPAGDFGDDLMRQHRAMHH